MKITAREAAEYFRHPSQQKYGLDPDALPEGLEYRARGPLCLMFEQAPAAGVYFVHMGMKPEGWGMSDGIGSGLVRAFWRETGCVGVIGWIPTQFRAAAAYAVRCGFERRGEIVPGVLEVAWRPKT
jgi:hypothetical protein